MIALAGPDTAVVERVDAYSDRAEEIWRGLEGAASPSSYFLSWPWVAHWLRSLPRGAAPELVVIRQDGAPAAAFFVGRRRELRHGFVVSRTLHLNATGCTRWDELTVEHNAVLCAPSASLSLQDLLEAMPGPWDEVVLPAFSATAFPGNALEQANAAGEVRVHRLASPYVDLAKVRAHAGGYLSLLRSTTRAQIRRTLRGLGDAAVELPTDLAHALDVYRELVALHTRGWQARGRPGAFADPWFEARRSAAHLVHPAPRS